MQNSFPDAFSWPIPTSGLRVPHPRTPRQNFFVDLKKWSDHANFARFHSNHMNFHSYSDYAKLKYNTWSLFCAKIIKILAADFLGPVMPRSAFRFVLLTTLPSIWPIELKFNRNQTSCTQITSYLHWSFFNKNVLILKWAHTHVYVFAKSCSGAIYVYIWLRLLNWLDIVLLYIWLSMSFNYP